MKVANLIKKLQKMPQDAQVIITNDDAYDNGDYLVTDVKDWGYAVEVYSSHVTRVGDTNE